MVSDNQPLPLNQRHDQISFKPIKDQTIIKEPPSQTIGITLPLQGLMNFLLPMLTEKLFISNLICYIYKLIITKSDESL